MTNYKAMTITDRQGNKVKFDHTELVNMVINQPGTIDACYSMFYRYSVRNTLLIARQQLLRGYENITPAANFNDWKFKLGRMVKGGEKGMEILQPVMHKYVKKDSNGNEIVDEKGNKVYAEYMTFRYISTAFAYSQTKPINGAKKTEQKAYNFDFEKTCKAFGVKIVNWNGVDGNAQGYAIPGKKEIAINPVASHADKTLIHELAHCILHKDCNLPQWAKEVQAETVAYIVMMMFGASETEKEKSRGYIQHWLGNNKLTDEITKPIIDTANDILNIAKGTYKSKRA